jgi:hypothetical protein
MKIYSNNPNNNKENGIECSKTGNTLYRTHLKISGLIEEKTEIASGFISDKSEKFYFLGLKIMQNF